MTMNTKLTIQEDRFLINGTKTYSELSKCDSKYHGLLMNARMIQGIFDDKEDVARFDRYHKCFDPQKNTDELIMALPQWYSYGLRAITVGFQGGGPCFTINNYTIKNNPYSEDGTAIDHAYLSRMDRIIRAADEIGMIVIVSFFYGAQSRFLKDDKAVMQAVKTASNWLRDQAYTNVIIEIANEHDVPEFKCHPILFTEEGIVNLIEIAQRESGGIPVGCSGTGGYFDERIANASDVILIHGNDQSKQRFYNLIQKAKAIKPKRPIVCNEDSQAISQLEVAFHEGISWGYYNNMTKQEPPVYWEITKGEDQFYAMRLAEYLGIEKESLSLQEQFYIQGLEPHMTYDGKRWIRLASLYPEQINYVEFYRNGKMVGTAYNDPFMLNSVGSTWLQKPFSESIHSGETWTAKVFLVNGTKVEVTQMVD